MVSGQYKKVRGLFLFYKIDVLIYGIRGAGVPALSDPVLRRYGDEEFVEFGIEERLPSERKMSVERKGFILGYDGHFSYIRIDAVAESEVYDPVFASERHGGFRPVNGEGMKALAFPSGQYDSQHFFHYKKSPFE
jgi:hypothetical protein